MSECAQTQASQVDTMAWCRDVLQQVMLSKQYEVEALRAVLEALAHTDWPDDAYAGLQLLVQAYLQKG